MRTLALTGACLLVGCLAPNPGYLGQGGATETSGQSGTVTGDGPTSVGGTTRSSGEADSGESSTTVEGEGPNNDVTACSGPLCVGEARCYDAEQPPSRVALGDVDGDGRLDVVSLSFEGESLQVWNTRNDGTLVPASTHDGLDDPRSLVVFDTNSNGRAELLVGAAGSQEVVVIDPADDTRGRNGTPGEPVAMAVGDGDSDGIADVVIAMRNPNQLAWALNAGDGTFQVGPRAEVDGAPSALALGLADDNSMPDAFVTANFAVELGCFTGKGDGCFDSGVGSQLWLLPYSVDTADLDHDGSLDVVISSSLPRTLEVLTDNGDTTFSSAETVSLGETPGQLEVVDLDLDGEPELVVTMRSTAAVWIYAGTPDLQYAEPIRVTLPDDGDGLAVGDLDGDGLPDIVATVRDASVVCVMKADSA